MKLTGLTEKSKLLFSLLAVAAAGAVWLVLSLFGVEMSFLIFAVLTFLLYFVIIAAWPQRD